MPKTMKVSSKGQVTIPKEIRDYLGSKVVQFEIQEGMVIVKPVKDVGGVLQEYASEHVPVEKAREETWEKVADEKEADEPA